MQRGKRRSAHAGRHPSLANGSKQLSRPTSTNDARYEGHTSRWRIRMQPANVSIDADRWTPPWFRLPPDPSDERMHPDTGFAP
jgi:hypothetical protein